ncbi:MULTISPECIES: CopL family metal-binding regulatory protein [Xanthomonas]|jgi:hypothetical protein|uniref:CopL family metal-binding regulatory protein n=1 Tax=Xanthomonas TaxID=338 RepID=UPI0027A8D496|nr:CopL family metal-binding regulatory protein [Xanthomonas campestris pv. raphani]WDJ08218.1 CopL family metal-binding regulatory protein [Xanthomonas campestris pv. incanae]
MTPSALLLRVLLSLVLILNGIGGAFAGAQMQMQHAHPGQPTVSTEATADVHAGMPECDQGMEQTQPAPTAVNPPSPDEAVPACCENMSCDCACAQHGSAMVAMSRMDPTVVVRAAALHPLTVGHVAPVLPSLIRPPIS